MGEAYEALGPMDSEPPPQPPAAAPPPPPPPPPPSAQNIGIADRVEIVPCVHKCSQPGPPDPQYACFSAPGTAASAGVAIEAKTKPAFGMAHENTDFGIVSAYTLNSAAAQPVIPEHSGAPVMKQKKKKERTRIGTILLVIFSILFGVSAVGVIVCIALIVFDVEIS